MAYKCACSCVERRKPINIRKWVVTQYKWNSGAFVSGDGERSDYSSVRCLCCGSIMRTKANYVEKLIICNHLTANEIENQIRNNEAYENKSIKDILLEFKKLPVN